MRRWLEIVNTLILFMGFSPLATSNCQSSISEYDFTAAIEGKMTKTLTCDKKHFEIKSHIAVDLLFYSMTYDETSKGKINADFEFVPQSYRVEDSREKNAVVLDLTKGEVDFQSLRYILGYRLAKNKPLPETLMMVNDQGRFIYHVKKTGDNVSIQTPLGLLKTTEIHLNDDQGHESVLWFWKENYSVAKEDIRENGKSIFEAVIRYQKNSLP